MFSRNHNGVNRHYVDFFMLNSERTFAGADALKKLETFGLFRP